MPVARRLMKPGTWSLKLRENTPKSVYSRVGRGDLLVLLPNRLQPVEGFSDASFLSAAAYTGTITALPSSTDLRGHGLEWWLGTPKGYGPGTAGTQGLLTTPVAFTAGTLSDWVTALCPPGLTVGTVTNGALPTLTNSYQFVTRREALDDVCRKLGAEYRVNPNGTIDAAAPATLFGSTATVVVTRKEEGRDGPYQGLQGSVISTSRDIEEFITKAVVVTSGTGAATTATTTTGSTLFRDPQGNLCHVERYIDAPSELAANAGLIGTAAINRFNVERRDLRLTSKTWNVSRFAEPGDYVYAYDAADGLVDAANQIVYRGEVITPLALRVFGLSWPIENGMGVYVRTATGVGTATWTDLTDYVVWETGDVSWEVGAARRPLVGTGTGPTSEGTVAYLGVNPAVNARAFDVGAWPAWATTSGHATDVSGAVGSSGGGTNWGTAPAVLIGAVLKEDRRCKAYMRITAGGTSISPGSAGFFRLNVPFSAAFSSPGHKIGSGFYLNAANTIHCPFDVVLVSATQAELYYPSTHLGPIFAITHAAPFALASGDSLAIDIDYQTAA